MTAIDTNILMYAHREDSPFHDKAWKAVASLAQGAHPWAIAWPCIHEFVAMATKKRPFYDPTPVGMALDQVERWLESPTVSVLGEAPGYWASFRTVVEDSGVTGPKIHDARVYAICVSSGVRTLWTADRDFERFSGLKIVNPLR